MTNILGTAAMLLELPEIAGWQIVHPPARYGHVIADLPALQRGAVWKVMQIEELWDSIVRTFPIGSFILSPPNGNLLRQTFKYQGTNKLRQQGTHLLLDGQQRANAIALAFDDIWSMRNDTAIGALWVDLAIPPDNRQVEFVFRVLTRSHPWGYRRDNPEEILSSSAIRSALCAYQAVYNCPDRRPEDFPLWQTWPWDAETPLPVAPLIHAILNNQDDLKAARDAYWKQLQLAPFLVAPPNFPETDERKIMDARRILESQRKNIHDSFEDQKSPWYSRSQRLVHVLANVLYGKNNYRVPALLLDLTEIGAEDKFRPENAKDAIELLFVRVNSAGTPLGGEELIYSLIKSEWPEVAEWMQKLPNRPALPSRIASLCVRLVLARNEVKVSVKKVSMPAMPGINEFRRLLRGDNANHPDFRQRLKEFIETDAANCLAQAWEFLTPPKKEISEKPEKARRDFRLLPAQAVDFAQNSPDVFLLLLRWIDRLNATGIKVSTLDSKVHRRSLGFLTAIAWFAPDKSRACASIWAEIEAELDNKKLIDRFNSTRFKTTCQISERFTLKMIPLPTPDDLKAVCSRFIDKDKRTTQYKKGATIHFPKGSFWTDRNWWYGQFCKTLADNLKKVWQEQITVNTWEGEEPPQYTALIEQAAQHFLDTLWGAKTSLLLYAQREWLQYWFPNFNPSLPEMMEDKNRPWDIDHILPQSYFSYRRDIPQSVKDWGNAIGNLRAWPLEANRADGDTTPKKKLTYVSLEEKRYGIRDDSDERAASFIDDNLDWDLWQNAAPTTDKAGEEVCHSRYLANDLADQYSDHRVAAITAIVLRFIALYRHWYEELRLEDLH